MTRLVRLKRASGIVPETFISKTFLQPPENVIREAIMVPRSSITERRTQGEEIHSQFDDAAVVVWVAAAVDPGILTVSPPLFKGVAGINRQ